MPVQVNARLTAVNEADVDPDWESSAGTPGAEKWHGSASAYYTEKRERSFSSGGDDIIVRRYLILDHDDAAIVDNDDVLTFSCDGVEQKASAKLIERRNLPGIQPGLRTTRIELDDA